MNIKRLSTLIKDPEKEVSSVTDLVYVTEEKLPIKRHRNGKGFYYTKNGSKITDPRSIKRFNSLVIPPGWKNVRITHLKNGHLQAVGTDTKNRKVYKYHEDWSRFRNQTKFLKMAAFGKKLPALREQIDKDLDLPEMNQKKVTALVLRLMEETHIRIGNRYYAKENKSYGLSTLRSRHLKTSRNKLKFTFTGKKGKKHSITLQNKKLIKLVNQCEEMPGWEVFTYYDENGKIQTIESGMVNSYIKECCGELFTAKDFRTWAATKVFLETVHQCGYSEEENENKKNRTAALDTVAEALGNTRTVCEKYYVHPYLTECFENGKICDHLKKLDTDYIKDSPYFSKSEKVLMKIMEEFADSLEKN